MSRSSLITIFITSTSEFSAITSSPWHSRQNASWLGNLQAIDNAAIEREISALGRFLITKKQSDLASFKTPDMRNILVTWPYFHDGSMETLWDIVDHYNKGDGVTDPWLDEDIQPLALTVSIAKHCESIIVPQSWNSLQPAANLSTQMEVTMRARRSLMGSALVGACCVAFEEGD